jgi:hypothetical protein
VAQGVGPEFNPQYCKKKRKKEKWSRHAQSLSMVMVLSHASFGELGVLGSKIGEEGLPGVPVISEGKTSCCGIDFNIVCCWPKM